ncbi:GNAT family N-acetyltransferase [Streptoalloteichus hindustanus]|uniref:Acetyltransferase (GNAT) family protein n=1 Tax=Streptoalloteichus hindustanus TaxID=2017 RepID=A0A1M5BVC1_STRHI|nr:GNAT family N-acetyltransferase [Streptoalloteichus hindustanus]SHF46237.1 Acetyltransferase (GNAT) family protein [Streptoalloteichus hindustanus]
MTAVDSALAARVAVANLASAARSRRRVPAGPLVGLLHEEPVEYLSYVTAARPGVPVPTEAVPGALRVLRAAFAVEGRRPRAELVDEANPGLVAAVRAAGFAEDDRFPLLVLDPADLGVPAVPPGVEVAQVGTLDEARRAKKISDAAFGLPGSAAKPPGDPYDGGAVVALLGGVPVATAEWTAIAGGVTEIAGVATVAEHRRQGLGSVVTAHAVLAAARAGADLCWLTAADDAASRVYQRIGFRRAATAVHLTDATA